MNILNYTNNLINETMVGTAMKLKKIGKIKQYKKTMSAAKKRSSNNRNKTIKNRAKAIQSAMWA